jgi:hypothetical protein
MLIPLEQAFNHQKETMMNSNMPRLIVTGAAVLTGPVGAGDSVALSQHKA